MTDDPLFFSFGVHNHSEAPVFDLSLDRIGYIELRDDGKMVPVYPAASFLATTRGRGSTLGFATQRELADPVLGPDAEVWVGYEWHDEEWFKSFRDLETLKPKLTTASRSVFSTRTGGGGSGRTPQHLCD